MDRRAALSCALLGGLLATAPVKAADLGIVLVDSADISAKFGRAFLSGNASLLDRLAGLNIALYSGFNRSQLTKSEFFDHSKALSEQSEASSRDVQLLADLGHQIIQRETVRLSEEHSLNGLSVYYDCLCIYDLVPTELKIGLLPPSVKGANSEQAFVSAPGPAVVTGLWQIHLPVTYD